MPRAAGLPGQGGVGPGAGRRHARAGGPVPAAGAQGHRRPESAPGLPFQGPRLARALAWLWLGSLPVLVIYLWVSDRINSLAVPVVFGLLGLLLSIALTRPGTGPPLAAGPEPLDPALCRRGAGHPRRPGPAGGPPGRQNRSSRSRTCLRLPSGRKVRTWQNIPTSSCFRHPRRPRPGSWRPSVPGPGSCCWAWPAGTLGGNGTDLPPGLPESTRRPASRPWCRGAAMGVTRCGTWLGGSGPNPRVAPTRARSEPATSH